MRLLTQGKYLKSEEFFRRLKIAALFLARVWQHLNGAAINRRKQMEAKILLNCHTLRIASADGVAWSNTGACRAPAPGSNPGRRMVFLVNRILLRLILVLKGLKNVNESYLLVFLNQRPYLILYKLQPLPRVFGDVVLLTKPLR